MVRPPGGRPPGPEAGEGLLSEILGQVAVAAEQSERPDQSRIRLSTDRLHLGVTGHSAVSSIALTDEWDALHA